MHTSCGENTERKREGGGGRERDDVGIYREMQIEREREMKEGRKVKRRWLGLGKRTNTIYRVFIGI